MTQRCPPDSWRKSVSRGTPPPLVIQRPHRMPHSGSRYYAKMSIRIREIEISWLDQVVLVPVPGARLVQLFLERNLSEWRERFFFRRVTSCEISNRSRSIRIIEEFSFAKKCKLIENIWIVS